MHTISSVNLLLTLLTEKEACHNKHLTCHMRGGRHFGTSSPFVLPGLDEVT